MTVRVPGKVNLQISVGPLRADGYHELVNVFHAVSLYDEVSAAPSDRVRVRVSGEGADQVPLDEDNLAGRAARLLADRTGHPARVALEIRKAIPVAGGMAGGSADAAAALVACDALWGTDLSAGELHALAAELGSDVPFALMGGTAVGRGRGEDLVPVTARGTFHWVFALAPGGLSTAAVYAECDLLRRHEAVPEPAASDALMAALAAGDAKALGAALANDLQPASLALRPQLAKVLRAGEDFGALGGIVSGSGPTCAFLAESGRHAEELALALSDAGVCRAAVRATGPVPGAVIV
ncbi:4-(cytidine 5'-diphospho)-2-C-methyl-D-erythritol kinase [Bailinhaonella thermotolerans]|uniref:4-(cytidine 5'-diphospho)-2-C-methyl-D-erythritol kinase n=1 Tax=Bailinhaonella thermotolerans TaxID=1070861 RepID=UPI00192A23AF|nr:4-(cytidine 5'-diphospho)-2-C-methyl-D-erythritol kinase [Bailinhaonella thermotolerans]